MWTLPIRDCGAVVGSHFHHRLGSLLRISPRYWGFTKRGWQERCILPPCPTTFCIFFVFKYKRHTQLILWGGWGGGQGQSLKSDTLVH